MTDDELKGLFDAITQEGVAARQENAAAHEKTRRHVDETAAETRSYVHQTAAETRSYVEQTAAETRSYVEQTTAETRSYVEQTAAETRRHFEVIAEHLETRIDAVAESVQILDEKVDRETANIRDDMARGFAETQAMIKFSHADLDRRMRTLEETVADLLTRVERLELSTH